MQARFVATEDGFVLVHAGVERLRHSKAQPMISCATGQADITMVRGNFAFADRKTPLPPLGLASLSGQHVELATDDGQVRALLGLRDEAERVVLSFSIVSEMPAAANRVSIRLAAQKDEHLWGGGEQMSYLCLNGRSFPMWTSEPGVGRDKTTALTQAMDQLGMAGGDYWTTNYPQPTFLSSAGYGVHVDTDAYSVLDFTDPAHHRIEVWNSSFTLEFFAGNTPAQLVSQFARRFGAKPALPDWAISGAIIGLKDADNSFCRLENIRAAGVPVSALWCEDWVGIRQTSFGRRLFWDWQWSKVRYPTLDQQIATLTDQGIGFLGYVNPYLAVDGPQFQIAKDLGFLALRMDNDDPYLVDFGEFDCGVVDFTNRDACAWFSEEIIGKQMLDFGLVGWMADFGEYLPVDLRLHDESDPMEAHNRWPVLWAKVNADAIESRGMTGKAVFFMRAGFSGVQAYCPLLWAGDQCVDFSRHDGINTAITAALSSGLVGNCVSHSDVGGYTSLHGVVRTDELLMRWMELGAFSPVFRSHEGNRPEDNLQIDSTPELLAFCAAMVRVHVALAPYVRHLLTEAATTGLPLQRPLFLHYPHQRETFTVQDQYLYGEDLLVAPIVTEGATSRTVLLPGKTPWVHVWSGLIYPSGSHEVTAPVGQPPVFYRPESAFAALFAGLSDAAKVPH